MAHNFRKANYYIYQYLYKLGCYILKRSNSAILSIESVKQENTKIILTIFYIIQLEYGKKVFFLNISYN